MSKRIPESYQPGIDRIEGMNQPELVAWLEGELREQTHILAGKEEDYPVQAIVNHHKYLSMPAQKRVSDALVELVHDWQNDLAGWPELAVRALLNLVAELRAEGAKSKLVSIVSDQGVWGKISPLQPAVFRAVATLSQDADRQFWIKIPKNHPEFAGMAFQVLTRIAAEDALQLLSRLPDDEKAIGSVARKLPNFVSQFPLERKDAILSHIAEAIAMLSDKSAETLRLALEHGGFKITTSRSASRGIAAFKEQMKKFAALVRPQNRRPLEYV